MKGYLVGYIEEWGYNRNPQITGYYINWDDAVQSAQTLERYNLDNRSGRQKVYIVEITPNKSYPVGNPVADWITNYPHHLLVTKNGSTELRKNGQPVPEQKEETDDWTEVRQRKPRRKKRLTRGGHRS